MQGPWQSQRLCLVEGLAETREATASIGQKRSESSTGGGESPARATGKASTCFSCKVALHDTSATTLAHRPCHSQHHGQLPVDCHGPPGCPGWQGQQGAPVQVGLLCPATSSTTAGGTATHDMTEQGAHDMTE
eukprot:11228293-Lingulodinium_polyedra.AAC.1